MNATTGLLVGGLLAMVSLWGLLWWERQGPDGLRRRWKATKRAATRTR
jgi:hypothetical protein